MPFGTLRIAKPFAAMLRCATHRRERAGGYRRQSSAFASLRYAQPRTDGGSRPHVAFNAKKTKRLPKM